MSESAGIPVTPPPVTVTVPTVPPPSTRTTVTPPPIGAPPPVVAPPPIAKPGPVPVPPQVPPGIPATLPDLGKLSGLLVLLGLIALLAGLVDFFNWLFRVTLAPFTRGKTPSQLTTTTVGQALTNTLGQWESKVDADLGASFNKLAQSNGRPAAVILTGAQISHAIALKLSGQHVRQAAQEAVAAQARIEAQTAQHRAAQATAAVAATAALAAAAEQRLGARVAAIEESITRLIEPELDGLRERIPKLERGVANGWDLLRQHDEALGIAGVTAATAAALGRIGGSWIACEANQLLGAALCRSDTNSLRKLLKGLIPLLAVADLCALLKAMTALADSGPVQEVLKLLADGVDDLLVCTRSERPTPLPIRVPDLGTLTAWATLTA